MEIECPTCGEPWDSDYVRRAAPILHWDVDIGLAIGFVRYQNSRFTGPNDSVLKAAEARGWSFSTRSVLSFTRCPACKHREPVADAAKRRWSHAWTAILLDGNDDVLAADLSATRRLAPV